MKEPPETGRKGRDSKGRSHTHMWLIKIWRGDFAVEGTLSNDGGLSPGSDFPNQGFSARK